ncbi:MAG TPA: hypothetical protein VH415_14090 [Nitrososphaeraceae archaeon]|jgi:hypothetical protein
MELLETIEWNMLGFIPRYSILEAAGGKLTEIRPYRMALWGERVKE